MCGICGFYGFEDQKLLKDMVSILEHRGPDRKGFYSDKLVSLGHARLSIIDLSEKGKQPIYNEDKSICIVFNGEIYNFKEIRGDLENKGHRFYSNTDTEAIIHSYEQYGIDCVNNFNGCFAFAIWDSNKKRLFLARDRLGIKPLYYYFKDDKFIFSSELKSILLYKEFKKEINYQALDDFLTLRFVPGPDTIFKNIKKLSPSCIAILEKNKLKIKKYWKINMNPINKPVNYFVKILQKELEGAVKRRLISDVPLGAFLSGGIDSSTVIAYMAKLKEEPIRTYAVSFGYEKEKDEMSYANLIANKFKTDHKEITVKADTFKILPRVIWHLDQPLPDPATIPTYLLSKEIRKYVKVVF